MAKSSNIAVAAKKFSEKWANLGYEKGQSQTFWLELLQSIFNIQDPFSFIEFEGQIKNRNSTSFMDAYIPSTKVLIEQKSKDKDLGKEILQSDGSTLTPYEQAKKYVVDMPVSKHPRWVVTCNFQEFRVYDMENPLGEPEIIKLKDLEKEYYRLSFLVDDTAIHTKKEVEVSMAAGRIIGEIYDAFLKEYRDPENPQSLRSLNILCVRLVFCLYAEDAGLFEGHSQFHDYLVQFKPGTGDMRKGLLELFDVLNTPISERDPYLRDDLQAFPYVNGGLFAEQGIEVPRFNETIANLLLKHASDDFDWSEISPTIFGGVFESTLNPETRRSGGMHYTSIENIHKVIDPLFLDDLKKELDEIKAISSEKKRIQKAQEFQDKLAGLKFLDPACGSGNFLTETFLSLRRLENEAIRIIYKGQMMIGEFVNPIKISINQFYGIEINDFAVSVAQTALWIAEAQMFFETEKLMQMNLDFLPLKSYTNIHEGNALRMDWNDVIPASDLNYIMGNPPFVANAGRVSSSESSAKGMQNAEQKEDKERLFGKEGGVLDYVSCWFKKASLYIKDTDIKVAFVSTSSICEGQQVPPLWKSLLADGVKIIFSYESFKWGSEASDSAVVYVIIVGFSLNEPQVCKIYDENGNEKTVNHINPYLLDAPDIFVEKRTTPLCDVPVFVRGCQPTDDGNFILTEEEKEVLLSREPNASQFIRPFMMGKDFIDRKPRYCLWLKGVEPTMVRKCPAVLQRVENVRNYRLKSTKAATRIKADTPMLFDEIREPLTNFIALPTVSSGNRLYIPIDYLSSDIIPGNKLYFMQGASCYHFGIITSLVHMGWMRAVGGYFGPSYNYSNTIVYNNFPWPTPSEVQKGKIEQTAQAILDARALYPNSSLADLYDDRTIPVELRKAHKANDAAVMDAYGFRKDMTEPEIVAELFKMYQKLTCK